MKTISLIIVYGAMSFVVAVENKSVDESIIKGKRAVSGIFGVPVSYEDFRFRTSSFDEAETGWRPFDFDTRDGWINSDIALGQIQLQTARNLALRASKNPESTSIAYNPEVVQAIQRANTAGRNVMIAQQIVDRAKQTALVRQKIALVNEANAREAALRSEEILTNARAEARASAKQLVASQQRLATLKEAVAAAQRVAAAREAAAAAAIQRTASETAARLRKQDVEKQIERSEEDAREKNIVAAKENAIAVALERAAAEKASYHPWG